MEEKEIWVDIEGYEGLYQISSKKRVRSVKTGRIKKPSIKNQVALSKNGVSKTLGVDKLYNLTFDIKSIVEDLEDEVWKNISELEGFEEFEGYQISNKGRVKITCYNGEKLKSLANHNYGYLQVGISNNGVSKTCFIHRLVALAFIPNNDPINNIQVNHINEIKTDNRAENLEWCTREYNMNYGTRTERQIQTCIKNGILAEMNRQRNNIKIYCLELDRVFPSIQSILDEFGYDRSNISCCLRHVDNQQTAYGMHWYYYEDYFKDEN